MDVLENTYTLIKNLQKEMRKAMLVNGKKMPNIKRLKQKSIAECAEDYFAQFLYNCLDDPNVKIYINPCLNKIHPDIVVIKNKQIYALIELKVTIGWHRNLFNPKQNGNYIYPKSEEIDKRYNWLEANKNKTVCIEGETLTINSKCKIYYVILSANNYISKRKVTEDFDESDYKNKISFHIVTDSWYNNPSHTQIKEEIKKYFENKDYCDYGINKLIEKVKMSLEN